MTAQQIEKFIDAGYSKAEIELLFKDPKVDPEPKDKDPEPKDKDPEPKDPEPKDKDKKEPENNFNEIAETIKSLTDTVNSLTSTVKALQDSNINKANSGKAKKDGITEAMQSFIDQL